MLTLHRLVKNDFWQFRLPFLKGLRQANLESLLRHFISKDGLSDPVLFHQVSLLIKEELLIELHLHWPPHFFFNCMQIRLRLLSFADLQTADCAFSTLCIALIGSPLQATIFIIVTLDSLVVAIKVFFEYFRPQLLNASVSRAKCTLRQRLPTLLSFALSLSRILTIYGTFVFMYLFVLINGLFYFILLFNYFFELLFTDLGEPLRGLRMNLLIVLDLDEDRAIWWWFSICLDDLHDLLRRESVGLFLERFCNRLWLRRVWQTRFLDRHQFALSARLDHSTSGLHLLVGTMVFLLLYIWTVDGRSRSHLGDWTAFLVLLSADRRSDSG